MLWQQIKNNIIKIKGLASIGSADIIGSGISAVFWFYLATVLEAEQFGEINYFLAIASLGYVISLIAPRETITVYAAKNVKLISTLYLISIIAGIISLFVILAYYYRLDVSLILIAYIVNDLTLGYLLGKKLFTKYASYILIQKGLTFGLGLGLFYVFGFEGIIYGLALSYVHFVIIFVKSFRESKVNFSLLKSNSGFVIHNYLVNLSSGFRSTLDKLLIVPLVGFAVLGNYSLALQLYAVEMIFPRIIFKYILPHDATGVSNKKLKKFTILIAIGITASGILLSPIIIPILFPKFINAILAIQIMSIAVISASINQIYTSKFMAIEKSQFILSGRLVSLGTIMLGILILAPQYGIVGISTAFVLSSIALTSCLAISDRFFIGEKNVK